MKVAFLNSFYPPDAAPTGQSLAEVVAVLHSRYPQIDVRVYTSIAAYRNGAVEPTPDAVDVVRIGSGSRRNGKLGRLAQSLSFGRRMAREAVAWADVIVSLTDPPLLGFWIGRLRTRAKRPIRWIEWTMDLYPEAFAAAGIVRPESFIYRYVARSQQRHACDGYVCLGEAQAAAVGRLRGVVRPSVVIPSGISEPVGEGPIPDWRQKDTRVVIAYAGNLGEAHCPNFLPALVETADPRRFAFLFAIGGAHASAVRQRLQNHDNVIWQERLSRYDLLHADVHAVSLMPRWTHVCVPSKAVSSICLGRPLLFAGDRQSDIATAFGGAAWLLSVPEDGRYDRSAIEGIFEEIADPANRAMKGRHAAELADALREKKERAIPDLLHMIVGDAVDPVRSSNQPRATSSRFAECGPGWQ